MTTEAPRPFTIQVPDDVLADLRFRPNQPCLNIVEIADLFATLTTDVLGYRRFAAQGGDWGAFITSRLGFAYPDRLAGIHVNLLSVRRDVPPPADPTLEEQAFMQELAHWQREETGYQWIQGTKPQTLAYGLRFARRPRRLDHREVSDLERRRGGSTFR